MATDYNDAEHIRALEYRLVNAFRDSNIEELNKLLADEFTITDPNGPSYSKEKYISEIKSGNIAFDTLMIDEMDIKIFEDTAITNGKATAKGRAIKGKYDGQYSFMDVYLKRQGTWIVILSTVSLAKILS